MKKFQCFCEDTFLALKGSDNVIRHPLPGQSFNSQALSRYLASGFEPPKAYLYDYF